MNNTIDWNTSINGDILYMNISENYINYNNTFTRINQICSNSCIIYNKEWF